jgi:hypothetical protein
MITIQNHHFADAPRIHLPVDHMPGQKYNRSVKLVEYPSLPGVIEMWIFNVDGWDIHDRVLP